MQCVQASRHLSHHNVAADNRAALRMFPLDTQLAFGNRLPTWATDFNWRQLLAQEPLLLHTAQLQPSSSVCHGLGRQLIQPGVVCCACCEHARQRLLSHAARAVPSPLLQPLCTCSPL